MEKIQKTMVTHSNRTKTATVTATGPEPEPEPEPNQSLQARPTPLPMHQNLLSVCHYTTEMPTVLVLPSAESCNVLQRCVPFGCVHRIN
jgi:hypothetical protein